MTRTALLGLCALLLALLVQCAPLPPMPPQPPPEDGPTRQELCSEVCERYFEWKLDKAVVCERFAEEPDADGNIVCELYGRAEGCVSDCVQTPGAWPENLACVLDLGGAGSVTREVIEGECPLPGGT